MLFRSFDRVENSGFEPLEDQAVGPFNLAIAPGVRHGGIVDVNAAFLAVVPEFGARNKVPRSVMIQLGTPNRCDISSMNSAALAAVVAVTGLTSIHFVNLSIATNI